MANERGTREIREEIFNALNDAAKSDLPPDKKLDFIAREIGAIRRSYTRGLTFADVARSGARTASKVLGGTPEARRAPAPEPPRPQARAPDAPSPQAQAPKERPDGTGALTLPGALAYLREADRRGGQTPLEKAGLAETVAAALQLPAGQNEVATEARLPAAYEAAKSALARCDRIDECQDWAQRAEALASYARQAQDEELRHMCDRIQARAVRRCGELLNEIRPAANQHFVAAGAGARPGGAVGRAQAARDAGLSAHQAKQALRVARVPAVEFRLAVENDKPATVTALAELGIVRVKPTLTNAGGHDGRPEVKRVLSGKDLREAVLKQARRDFLRFECTYEHWNLRELAPIFEAGHAVFGEEPASETRTPGTPRGGKAPAGRDRERRLRAAREMCRRLRREEEAADAE